MLRVPKNLNTRKHTPGHIINTFPKMKDKERILKAARRKERVTYKGVPIRQSADLSKETLQARRGWREVFQVMKGNDLHPRLLYPAKLSDGRADKVLPRKGQVQGVHHQQSPYYMSHVKGTYLRKKRSKTRNSKMTTNSQLSTTEPKKNKNKNKTKHKTTRGTE